MKKCILLLLLFLFFLFSCKNDKAPIAIPLAEKLFPKVKIIVRSNCTVSCHAPSMGFNIGLPVVLENDTDIVYHASGIKAAVADPVTPTNHRMPQGGNLSASDIDIIKKWFEGGGSLNN